MTNTNTNIEAVENAGLEVVYTLKNGVKKFPLLVENDFQEAQEMLDICELTECFDAESIFNKRPQNNFVGTYEISIESKEAYNKFIDMLEDFVYPLRNKAEKLKESFKNVIFNGYHSDKISRNNAVDWLDILNYKVDFERYVETTEDESKMLSFRFPTIEEWQSGKYNETEKRVTKLGKTLLKNKFPQALVDFYSLQTKTTDKKVYLTISDKVQHITGMSNYVDLDSKYCFDGYQSSSCQDTRHGYEEVYKLGASLHDDKLFIAMLHFDLDDINDMHDKLIARTMLRYMNVDGKPLLMATNLYGKNDTKQWLKDGIASLNEMDIYGYSHVGCDRLEESANGCLTKYMTDEVNVCETIDEYVTCECPMCGGSGEYEVYSSRLDRHVDVECPACSGDGKIEANVYVEVDEWVEVEDETEILPYNEGYSHYGYKVTMNVDIEAIRETRESFATCKECNELNNECTCLDFD